MSLINTSSPHLRQKLNTRDVMLNVIIALIPAVIASLVLFRFKALFLIAVCVVCCVLTEEAVTRIRNKPSAVPDLSAALTGLLLALILPPSTRWYAAVLGSVFSILVAKHLFGGIGSNIFNPALIGRAFLMVAYPKMLTTFVEPFAVDVVTKATPLALHKFSNQVVSTFDLFFGTVSGSLGETSAVCLIVGGLYLLIRKIADWRIPLSMLVSASVFSFIFYCLDPSRGTVFFHLFSGGMLIGAFFMATDPVTTPVTKLGRYVFGVGCGLLVMTIRYFGGYPEGVMYSILFFNALTPLINRCTKPRRFGA
ncbi:MAG: RnfABCDGE type electron transport complex subunit D [Candidatus Omnitrophica bacterium]|nr:RnfABCDGE type electron transport complex subunit D [Candidatus Omnitrophota bacterium]